MFVNWVLYYVSYLNFLKGLPRLVDLLSVFDKAEKRKKYDFSVLLSDGSGLMQYADWSTVGF
jgi:hypothetical protein